MQYEESYQGNRVVVTTKQGPRDVWTAKAQFVEGSNTKSVVPTLQDAYSSEEDARRAAFSAAAAAIDRARSSRGKP